MVHGSPQLSLVKWDGFGRIQWGRYNGEDTAHGVKEFAEEGDITTLGAGSAKVGNGEYATTLDLSEVWDGL